MKVNANEIETLNKTERMVLLAGRLLAGITIFGLFIKIMFL